MALNAMLVEVIGLESAGNVSIVKDGFGRIHNLDANISPGLRPQVGEVWIVEKVNGRWLFAKRTSPVRPQVQTPNDVIAAMDALGLLDDVVGSFGLPLLDGDLDDYQRAGTWVQPTSGGANPLYHYPTFGEQGWLEVFPGAPDGLVMQRYTAARPGGDVWMRFLLSDEETWTPWTFPGSRMRLPSTEDASPTSDEHPFQIGSTTDSNLRMDNNEILALINGAPGVLALQNDGGEVRVGGISPAMLRVRGSLVVAQDDLNGIWTSYTPAVANMTVGNGTFSCQWKRIGTTVIYRGAFVLGSTSAMTTNAAVISMPLPLRTATDRWTIGEGMVVDASTGQFFPVVSRPWSNNQFVLVTAAGWGVSNPNPFTWAVSDSFGWNLVYETNANTNL